MLTVYNPSIRKYVNHRNHDAGIIVSIIAGMFVTALFFLYGVKI